MFRYVLKSNPRVISNIIQESQDCEDSEKSEDCQDSEESQDSRSFQRIKHRKSRVQNQASSIMGSTPPRVPELVSDDGSESPRPPPRNYGSNPPSHPQLVVVPADEPDLPTLATYGRNFGSNPRQANHPQLLVMPADDVHPSTPASSSSSLAPKSSTPDNLRRPDNDYESSENDWSDWSSGEKDSSPPRRLILPSSGNFETRLVEKLKKYASSPKMKISKSMSDSSSSASARPITSESSVNRSFDVFSSDYESLHEALAEINDPEPSNGENVNEVLVEKQQTGSKEKAAKGPAKGPGKNKSTKNVDDKDDSEEKDKEESDDDCYYHSKYGPKKREEDKEESDDDSYHHPRYGPKKIK